MTGLAVRLIIHKALAGLGYGLTVSVQGLFFIEKGVELWQVGLLFGLVAAATAVFELPLGAASDIYGRIRIFRLSRIVYALSALVAVFAGGFFALALSMVLVGLAQALDSGSIDAWAVEQINARNEGHKLQSYITNFQAAVAAGMAGGALIGGFLPQLVALPAPLPPTAVNFAAMGALAVCHFLLAPALFFEGDQKAAEPAAAFGGQMVRALRFSASNFVVRSVLLFGLLTGFFLTAVEAYWQPRLDQLDSAIGYGIFGIVTAGFFLAGVVGPLLIGAIARITNASPTLQLVVLSPIMAVVLGSLSLQASVEIFGVTFVVVMLVFSMTSSPMFTLVNQEVADRYRSTVQSIVSLTFMIGATLSAGALSLSVKWLGIPASWQLTAGLMAVAGWALLIPMLLHEIRGAQLKERMNHEGS